MPAGAAAYFGAHAGQASPDVSLPTPAFACGITFVFGGFGVAATVFGDLGVIAPVFGGLGVIFCGWAVAFATNSLAFIASAMACV